MVQVCGPEGGGLVWLGVSAPRGGRRSRWVQFLGGVNVKVLDFLFLPFVLTPLCSVSIDGDFVNSIYFSRAHRSQGERLVPWVPRSFWGSIVCVWSEGSWRKAEWGVQASHTSPFPRPFLGAELAKSEMLFH